MLNVKAASIGYSMHHVTVTSWFRSGLGPLLHVIPVSPSFSCLSPLSALKIEATIPPDNLEKGKNGLCGFPVGLLF